MFSPDEPKLCNRLRALRRSLGMSRAQLREAAQLNPRTLLYLENQDYSPSVDLAWEMADLLTTELTHLFFRLPAGWDLVTPDSTGGSLPDLGQLRGYSHTLLDNLVDEGGEASVSWLAQLRRTNEEQIAHRAEQLAGHPERLVSLAYAEESPSSAPPTLWRLFSSRRSARRSETTTAIASPNTIVAVRLTAAGLAAVRQANADPLVVDLEFDLARRAARGAVLEALQAERAVSPRELERITDLNSGWLEIAAKDLLAQGMIGWDMRKPDRLRLHSSDSCRP